MGVVSELELRCSREIAPSQTRMVLLQCILFLHVFAGGIKGGNVWRETGGKEMLDGLFVAPQNSTIAFANF